MALTGTFRINNGIVLAEAAAAGCGVVVSPTFYVGPMIRAGRLRQVLAAYELPTLGIYAVYPQTPHIPPKVRAFVDFLVQRFGRKPDWERF